MADRLPPSLCLDNSQGLGLNHDVSIISFQAVRVWYWAGLSVIRATAAAAI